MIEITMTKATMIKTELPSMLVMMSKVVTSMLRSIRPHAYAQGGPFPKRYLG